VPRSGIGGCVVAGRTDRASSVENGGDGRGDLGAAVRSPAGNVGGRAKSRRLAVVFNGMLNRLRNSFDRQVQFTADASHELRTPVSVILSQSELALARPRSTEEYTAALETCLRGARRMRRMVDDLLDLARADSGRLNLKLGAVDLAQVVRSALQLLEPLAAEAQVRLGAHLPPAVMPGDASRLGQVISNLVTNAIQYNRPGGEVFITLLVRHEESVVLQSPTPASGIPAEHQARLFERFYRVDGARTQGTSEGTGLGLSIVAEIVAAHHGRIEVTSEPGVGTTVTVAFPVTQQPAFEATAVDARNAP